MPNEIPLVMPKMSMTMEKGELLSWEAQEGDTVRAGDVVAVVQTDKVDMEVEAPVAGTLVRLVAEVGAAVPVGQPLAFIASDSESLLDDLLGGSEPDAANAAERTGTDSDGAAQNDATDGAAQDGAPDGAAQDGAAVQATPPSRLGPLPAVPKARRRAAELHVSLRELAPSGAGGVITVADVERAAQARSGNATNGTNGTAATAAPGAGGAKSDTDPAFADSLAPRRRAVRSAVARTMAASATVPQFTAFTELDLEDLQRAREGVGWTTLLVRALARALRAHPQVLAGWDDVHDAPAAPPDSCGVALAVDTAVGLLAPVVRDADTLGVGDLDAQVRELVGRARAGRLTMADLAGAATTLSNLGQFAVPYFTSLLTSPQSTALSVGAIAPRPFVRHGGLAVRLGVVVGLTVDHRAVDGADAARVLAELSSLCGRPADLLT